MPSRHFLVIDAGTSALRCFVFNERAKIVSSRSEPWSFAHEEGVSPFAKSFDVSSVWDSCRRIILDGMAEAGISASQVQAVAVTSQRQGVVFLDEDGEELYAGPNTDLRAVFEGGEIDSEHREDVFRITGHLPSFLFAPAKLTWFKIHRPDDYQKIAAVLTIADWIVWRLTGVLSSEASLAGEAGLLNIEARRWSASLLDKLGLDVKPVQIVHSGAVVGEVSPKAASEFGLKAGTIVAAAGADSQCGLLGLGIRGESHTGIVSGWSTAIQMLSSQPIFSPDGKTWAGCFLEKDKWILESSPGDTGNSYQWLANTLYEGHVNPFDAMNSAAGNVPVGSDGVKVFLGAPKMDMSKVGMTPGGFIFPVPLTFSGLGKEHFVRACLESIAYSIRANIEQLEELSQNKAGLIAIGGGMTRTPVLTHILANVLGREIAVSPNPHTSALGAYLCARTAAGDFDSLEQAARSVEGDSNVIEPDIMEAAEYDDHYNQWLETSNKLQELNL